MVETMSENKIFSTLHGSRLYGMAHADSDNDQMIVYADERKAVHKHIGKDDTVHVGLVDFLNKAFSGSHQSLEALFSPYKVYYNEAYKPMLEAAVVPANIELRDKYRRTIHKFCHGTFKQRRHALRLALNLRELTLEGRFDPRLSWDDVQYITDRATTFEGDDLYALAMLHAESRS